MLRTLPDEPRHLPELDAGAELSFPLVLTLDVDPAWQQAFLEIPGEVQRLERLDAVFQAALAR